MYLRGLGKMGFWEILGAQVVGAALNQRRSATPGYGTPDAGGNTVSVSTQVSPQISPVFVQQDSPRDSPVNAAPVSMPSLMAPMPGMMPGVDTAAGYLPSGAASVPLPSNSISSAAGVGLLAALGLLAFSLVKRKKGRRR